MNIITLKSQNKLEECHWRWNLIKYRREFVIVYFSELLRCCDYILSWLLYLDCLFSFRSEYGAFWKCAQVGGMYLLTELCKMLLLATFFPTDLPSPGGASLITVRRKIVLGSIFHFLNWVYCWYLIHLIKFTQYVYHNCNILMLIDIVL